MIYKLCEKADEGDKFVPAMKLSQGKITLPSRKQVFRVLDKKGVFSKDIIALHNEEVEGAPLLIKVMDKGKLTVDLPTLEGIRRNALENLSRLPNRYKQLKKAPHYPVLLSPKLKKMMTELANELRKREGAV